MPGFPADAVVETNAVFSRNSVQPVITAGLPASLRSLTLLHTGNQEGIVSAAIERDLDAAFRVFLNDPMVMSISREDAHRLFKHMTENTLPLSMGYK